MKLLVLGNPDSIWTREFVECALIQPDRKISVLYDSQAKGEFVEFYKKLGVEVIRTSPVSPIFLKFPKLRGIFMSIKYYKVLSHALNYDAIINMFVTPFTLACAIAQKRYGVVIIAYFCGSDIVRANRITSLFLKRSLRNTNYAIMASTNVQKAFKEKIGQLEGCKQKTIRLGISVFSNIERCINNSCIENCKNDLGISIKKVTICIGYNGSIDQNHLLVLKQIKMLPDITKIKIQILLPMTYASTEMYISQVEATAKEVGSEYIIFKKYMQHEEIAKFRLATDIFINAQKSDGLSGSVLETLYAGALLLNASWLNYTEFDNWGLKYDSFSRFTDLPELLDDMIKQPLIRREENRKVLANTMSWEQCRYEWNELLNVKSIGS